MQFTGHSLPVHQSMNVQWDFTLFGRVEGQYTTVKPGVSNRHPTMPGDGTRPSYSESFTRVKTHARQRQIFITPSAFSKRDAFGPAKLVKPGGRPPKARGLRLSSCRSY